MNKKTLLVALSVGLFTVALVVYGQVVTPTVFPAIKLLNVTTGRFLMSDSNGVTTNSAAATGTGTTPVLANSPTITTPTLASQIFYGPIIPGNGLVGYWSMDETSGIRYDRGLYGLNLNPTNSPGSAAGVVNNCATFSSSRLGVADSSFLPTGGSSMTVAFWLKLNVTNSTQVAVAHWDTGSNQRGWRFVWTHTVNRLSFGTSPNGTSVNAVEAATYGGITPTAWVFVVGIHDAALGTNFISINNGPLDHGPATTILDSTAPLSVGCFFSSGTANSPLNGNVDELGIWNRRLTASEIELLYSAGLGVAYAPTISSPSQYMVFQRNGSGQADIPISGTVDGVHSLEARFAGGAWAQIATNVYGSWSGTLSAQSQGSGLLEVRLKDAPHIIGSVTNIGIGDVFVVAGQSNHSGRGTNNQVYAGSSMASLFKNSYQWGVLADPMDSALGQVDTVSSDPAAAGSIFPLIANRFATNQANIPIAFVPSAQGGTAITAWLPSGSATNRATLYGSMVWRAKYAITGGVKAVLWWQGETDAIAAMSQATYYDHLTNFTANVQADLGVKVMASTLMDCSGISAPNQAEIDNAIQQAWASDSNTLTGPNLTAIPTNDPYHATSDATLAAVANAWWNAMYTEFYAP